MMMKWGGRKPGSSSPSVSSHHHASSFSWFSKLKHMKINSSSEPTTTTHHANIKKQKPPYQNNNTSDAVTTASSTVADDASSSLFHDEDNFIDSCSSFPAAARRNSSAMKHTAREGALISNNKNKLKKEKKESGIIPTEERKFVDDRKVEMEMQEHTRDDKEYENLRRRFERKAQKVLQEQLFNLEKERGRESRKLVQEIKDVEMQLDSPRTICTPRIHYSLPSSSDSKSSNSVRSKKNNNILEKKLMMNPTEELDLNLNLKVKTKKKKQQTVVDGNSSREIIHQRRKSKHSPRIRIHSPRMSSPKIDQVCRIKAIEDMKKARLKMKKEREEIIVQEALLTKGSEDRFAVIKCSLDPRKDFRDSMIEMIIEKQIRNPEEMEELLACYLTLNADEYHDLIIQVFRQVWFQMSYGA